VNPKPFSAPPAAIARRVLMTAQTEPVDDDLEAMTRQQLVAEVIKLRTAVRRHGDSSGHDLCWHHPDLWRTLPEQVEPEIAVPAWPQFLRGCIAYRQSLDEQAPEARSDETEYGDQSH
jgi:hypothetical protein